MTGEMDGTFAGAGGIPIYYQRAAPAPRSPGGVVLIAHGYAEHLGRYRAFVAHLTGRGFATAAVDHRGHGRSGGPRGHCRTFADFVADLRTLADMTERWWPDVPRLLFGHTIGGLIAFLYLLRHPETVRAGALSAPAFRVPDVAPRSLQMVALLLGRVAPGIGLRSNLDERLLSRDPAAGAAYVADPLVHRRGRAGVFPARAAAAGGVGAPAGRGRAPPPRPPGGPRRAADPPARPG